MSKEMMVRVDHTGVVFYRGTIVSKNFSTMMDGMDEETAERLRGTGRGHGAHDEMTRFSFQMFIASVKRKPHLTDTDKEAVLEAKELEVIAVAQSLVWKKNNGSGDIFYINTRREIPLAEEI